MGRSRRTVQRVLREAGQLPASSSSDSPAKRAKRDSSKLDPYREEIKDRVTKGLTTTRILREVQELGYAGGRTILNQYVRALRAPLAPKRKVTRRFETGMGEEGQCDWSTYRIVVGGVVTVIQVLAVVLARSRRSFLWATDNQKLPRLLEGLTLALEHFEGVTQKLLFDNMAVVTLGRVGKDRRPIWNPGFLDFAKHYGFEPAVCRIAHPDRKGEVEAALGYFERDCLRGLEPESLAALNRAIRRWVDEIANKRVHGTTGRVPDEAWAEERPFLIPLPERRYPGACVEEMRRVAEDCTVSVQGTTYTVPARLAHRQVRVRLYSERFEVLDRDGSVALEREYVTPREKGRLVLDPAHYQDLPAPRRRERGATRRLEEQLLARWPALEGFLEGLKLRVKSLVHVHLRKLLVLAERYGEPALLAAAETAHQAGLHTANSVERILERDFQEVEEPDPIVPLEAETRVVTLLGEVESGSLDDYAHLDDVAAEEQEDEEDGRAGDEVDHGA
ncbi:MAG: IS21 family transposase [Burkholderiales bacterium]